MDQCRAIDGHLKLLFIHPQLINIYLNQAEVHLRYNNDTYSQMTVYLLRHVAVEFHQV